MSWKCPDILQTLKNVWQNSTTPFSFLLHDFFFSCKIHLGKSSNLQKTWLAYICIYLCILPLEKSDISINSKEFLMPFKLCTSKFFHGKNNHGVCMSNSMLPIRKEFITLLSYQSLSWRAKHTYAQYAIHTHTHKIQCKFLFFYRKYYESFTVQADPGHWPVKHPEPHQTSWSTLCLNSAVPPWCFRSRK